MQTISIENDIAVFGKEVVAFPFGTGEAFEALVKLVPGGFSRSYYGICVYKDGRLHYYATAEQNYENEAADLNCSKYCISKGEYLFTTVNDWRTKTASVNNIFEEMMKDARADHMQPIVEWYKDDDEMLCMVRCK